MTAKRLPKEPRAAMLEIRAVISENAREQKELRAATPWWKYGSGVRPDLEHDSMLAMIESIAAAVLSVLPEEQP